MLDEAAWGARHVVAPGRVLALHLGSGEPAREGGTWTYRVAGQPVRADRPIRRLGPWLEGSADDAVGQVAIAPAGGRGGRLIHSGSGLIADAWREVGCYREPCGYRVTVAGVGSFFVQEGGAAIVLLQAEAGVSEGALEEALLGPALILALALRDTWCLHASAVLLGDRAVAFAGDSGRGKSTMAEYFGQEGVRLADDILPVASGDGGPMALPRYPQLKIPPAQQPDLIPERAALSAIYALAPARAGQEAVLIEPMAPRRAMLALVRHTVAARLFDEALMARHLAFCADTAARLPVRSLRYPRRQEALSEVRDRIAADLQAHGGG